jgi:hypothetical protein
VSLKIALIGSAPSSVQLAPWDDPSWKIYSCSPGARPYVKRCDAHFELHKWERAAWFSNEYIVWMAGLSKVYMIRPAPEIPNSVAYPRQEIMERYGYHAPYVFTSSLSWMFALAIAEGATEIALYGVDMSATEEYGPQREGCHFFIAHAKSLGIKVTVPDQSDLLRPAPLYGFCEEDPHFGKLLARKQELTARRDDAIRREAQAHDERMFLQGGLDNIEYDLKTWVADPQAIAMTYAQPVWVTQQPVVQQVVAQSATTESVAEPVIATETPIRDTLSVAEPIVAVTKQKRKYVKKANGVSFTIAKATRKRNNKSESLSA